MTWFKWLSSAALLSASLWARAGVAAEAPDPREVYEVLRTNLTGLTDAQLQTATVEGLVKELQPRVWLVGNETATEAATGPALSKTSVFDGPVAYIRVGRVGKDLAQELKSAYAALSSTNHLQGLVLDLRFADGEDYQTAAATADLFVTKEQPLLDWGPGSARATGKTNALKLPVAVLVNQQTAAAAEALAAVLRDVGTALVMGASTAGRAMLMDDFQLKNGQHLRIAKSGVKLGSGAVLSTRGVRPDIEVAVSAQDERAYWTDPFKNLSPNTNPIIASATSLTTSVPGVTNRPSRRRPNEAELVRERRSGAEPGAGLDAIARRPDPEQPVVRDPALARALDLIKGLAIVRQWRAQ